MKKTACLFLIFFTLISLSSCSPDNKNINIACAIFSEPGSMDPSVAKDNEALLIIANIFEGLTRLDSQNNVVGGIAKSWQVSEDKTRYTFTLRDDIQWSDGTPLTANDIKFGCLRTLLPETRSTIAGTLYCIKNAKAVHTRLMNPEKLGITVPDDKTIVFDLEYPEPDFLRILSQACAMPCNEEFFESTKGRYGLEQDTILSNGPFELTRWKHGSQITIKKNPNYHDNQNVIPASVTLKILNDNLNAVQMLVNEDVHISQITRNELAGINKTRLNLTSFKDTTWALCFNLKGGAVENKNVRLGLIKGIEKEASSQNFPDFFVSASGLIPPASTIDGESFRELFSTISLPNLDPAAGKQHLTAGFTELGLTKQPKITLICPEDTEIRAIADLLLQQWHQNLNVYINLEPLNKNDLADRIKSGDYQIALYPVTAKDEKPLSLLNNFKTAAPENIIGYTDPQFDKLLGDTAKATTSQERVTLLSRAEQQLIDEAVIFPLFYESRYYGTVQDISGTTFRPFNGVIDFASIKVSP